MAFQKWQVLSGSHRQRGKSYKKGQKFVTERDMTKFNTLPRFPKYNLIGPATDAEILQAQAEVGFTGEDKAEPIEDETEETNEIEEVSEVVEDSLEAMTVSELKALASDESIDLTGATTKEKILAKIREARAE